MKESKRLLIITPYYTPAIKGGGPIKSIKNIVESLSDKYEIYILTSDRDLGDNAPFDDIKTGKWIKCCNYNVYYADSSKLNFVRLRKIINLVNADLLYLNSFFSFKFSIIPIVLKKTKLIFTKNIIIAPRGEFSKGAIKLKENKKRAFILMSRLFRLHKTITWHATAEEEKRDILVLFKNPKEIKVVNNLPSHYEKLNISQVVRKHSGELKIIFLSRIHPKKNLTYALELLKDFKEKNISFDIYGPIEDEKYWVYCKKVIDELNNGINVVYKGIVKPENVESTFRKYHLFLFPTLGENYGHVISEALSSGCPVLISDQTPWKELSRKGVGWDLKLENKNAFKSVIHKMLELTDSDFKVMAKKSNDFAIEKADIENQIKKYINLFDI